VLFFFVVKGEKKFNFFTSINEAFNKKSEYFVYLFTSIYAFYDGKIESFNVFFMCVGCSPLVHFAL